MIYTQEQLNEMSDNEINLAVANLLSHKNYTNESTIRTNNFEEWMQLNDVIFNPCGNWNDVMPIAEKYGIEVAPRSKTAWAYDEDGVNQVVCKDAKRAICGVFLMMEVI